METYRPMSAMTSASSSYLGGNVKEVNHKEMNAPRPQKGTDQHDIKYTTSHPPEHMVRHVSRGLEWNARNCWLLKNGNIRGY